MSENEDHSWLKDIRKMDREDLRAYYDQWAESYDETLQSWDYQAPKQAAAMLKPLISTEATIFDAGCGTGLSGLALRDAGYTGRIDGSDLSPESVELARKREIYNAVQVIDLDKHPLPLESDLYDATISIGVLTYIKDMRGLLTEFCRVTRPGGYLLFTHRDDLVAEQDFLTLTRELEDKGLWKKVKITDSQPYLPGHPDYADNIGIIYFLFQVN